MGQTIVAKVIEMLQAAEIRTDEAYPGGRLPALTGPVAAVRLGKVDRAVRATTVQITVMSPAGLGGSTCEAVALRAMQALEDQGGICQKGLCQFDDMADLFFIEIAAEFLGVALENDWMPGPGFAITIGLQKMEWATDFTITRWIGDEAASIKDSPWQFTLEELLGPGSVDPPEPAEPFILHVERLMGDEVFTGCVWTHVERQDTLRGIRQIRTGVAQKRTISGILG